MTAPINSPAFDQAAAEVKAANTSALDAWGRAARHLGLAYEAAREGCDHRDKGYRARARWMRDAKASGASAGDVVKGSSAMPLVDLPKALKRIVRWGRTLEVLARELAEQDTRS